MYIYKSHLVVGKEFIDDQGLYLLVCLITNMLAHVVVPIKVPSGNWECTECSWVHAQNAHDQKKRMEK